jgi:phosphate transport system substrate-binding protein
MIMMRAFCLCLISFTISIAGAAQDIDFLKDLKPYQPEQKVSGTIRNWGNNYIPGLTKDWEEGFRKYQPDVQFETRLPGTEAGMAGVYGGIADLGFIGREVYPEEHNAFVGVFGYEPTVIEISSGSYATPHHTFSLQVFVHNENPISKLTFAQLNRIFGCGCSSNVQGPIRKWGQLGLSGDWADKPIHVYGYNFDTGMAGYFNKVVLSDSSNWNSELKDFDNGRDEKGEVINAGVYILRALADDPYGIAFANVMYGNAKVKALPLARAEGGPYVEPSKENVWRRSYPITRYTTVVINRPPGKPVDPKVKEFLRYILSRDGMAAVVRDGAYLPLTRELIEEQLRKLE